MIAARTLLFRPPPLKTPGAFNYKKLLLEKNIHVTGRIKSTELIHRVHHPPSFREKVKSFPSLIQDRINANIEKALSDEQIASLYKTLLTGDRTSLSREILEGYKHSGTMHILAISGLHISILGTVFYAFFYFILSRSPYLLHRISAKKTSAFLCLLPLTFYGLISGMNLPVVRALIMAGMVIIALCVNRTKSPLTLISFAALLVLAIHPNSISSPSFQLSFSAVTGITLLLTRFPSLLLSSQRKNRVLHWGITGILVSLVATLFTTPFSLYHFNRISLAGPFTNLIIESLVCLFSLPLGFASIVTNPISSEVSDRLLQFGSVGLQGALHLNKYLLQFPDLSLWRPSPAPPHIAIYYISLVSFFFFHKNGKQKLLSILPFLLSILLFVFPPQELLKSFRKTSRISFIAVGQGSSTLITCPEGLKILIDCGGNYSPIGNSGERIIGPYLYRRGFNKIDHVYITHPDRDHVDGLAFIANHFSPDSVIIRKKGWNEKQLTRLQNLAAQFDFQIIDQQSLKVTSKNSYIKQIPILYEKSVTTPNDNGMILQYVHGDISVLFPGDISRNVEKLVATSKENYTTTILLSPHHGSKTSSSPAFLEKIHPELIIISAGSSGHFPAKQVIERYKKMHLPYLITDKAGTIEVTTNGASFNAHPYLKESGSHFREIRRRLP